MRLVVDSVTSPHSKRAYGAALDDFAQWTIEQEAAGRGSPSFSKAIVQSYRSRLEEKGLAPSSVNVRLAALRKLAVEAADNGLLDPDVASAIGRLKGSVQKGRRIGRWLTREEASLLLRDSGEEALKAKRDRALLCLLLGAGLRREEIVSLEIGHIQQRDGRWVIVDLLGKRQRIRSVPIPGWSKAAIDHWINAAGITEGRLFRAVDKAGRMTGETLSTQAVYLVVTERAKKIGLALAPHDVRRTFAKLAHKGRVPIEQIQLALGHESIQTTERYLGVQQDLLNAPGEYLGLEVDGHLECD
jgi:integrase